MSINKSSTRQQSSRKRFIKWFKGVLRNKLVFQACILGLRLIICLRSYFRDEA